MVREPCHLCVWVVIEDHNFLFERPWTATVFPPYYLDFSQCMEEERSKKYS